LKLRQLFYKYLSFLPFQVLSFTKSNCSDFIAEDEWSQFTRSQSTGLSRFGEMLKSYYRL